MKPKSYDPPHDQEEGLLGRRAKAVSKDCSLNVRVLVYEPHTLLQAVEATLAAAEHCLGNAAIHLISLSLH